MIDYSLSHEVHKKGWGYEVWVANSPKYCGKILHMKPSTVLSYHYHKIKHETFFILEGTGTMIMGKANGYPTSYFKLKSGVTIEIPPETPHMVMAGDEGLNIMEVSTEHFEDDSYRILKGD